jgi:hypothetical protein
VRGARFNDMMTPGVRLISVRHRASHSATLSPAARHPLHCVSDCLVKSAAHSLTIPSIHGTRPNPLNRPPPTSQGGGRCCPVQWPPSPPGWHALAGLPSRTSTTPPQEIRNVPLEKTPNAALIDCDQKKFLCGCSVFI